MARPPALVTVCIDDTDGPDSRGTAKLALSIIAVLQPRLRCFSLTTHPHLRGDNELFDLDRNHSSCLRFHGEPGLDLGELVHEIRCLVLEDLVQGSNPGICVGRQIPDEVQAFAERSRNERLESNEAHALALAHGLHLEALAGDGSGVIGALAGAGTAAAGGPGTYLQLGEAPLDLRGLISPRKLVAIGIEHLVDVNSGVPIPL